MTKSVIVNELRYLGVRMALVFIALAIVVVCLLSFISRTFTQCGCEGDLFKGFLGGVF